MGTINGSYPTGASTANGRVYVENGASVTSTGAREVYIEISPTTGQNFNGTWTFKFIPVTLGAANGEVDLWRYYTSTTAITANFVTGNQANEEIVSEPGNAYNVITVAATDSIDICQPVPTTFHHQRTVPSGPRSRVSVVVEVIT